MSVALWVLVGVAAAGTLWAAALSIDGAWRAMSTRVRLARHRARTRPLPLRVRARHDVTDGLFAVELSHPRGRRLPRARPGQYVTLLLRDADGVTHRRAYSVANAMRRARHYELVIRREAAGRVSPRLHHALMPGAIIDALPPRGAFTPRASRGRPVVLLAGGVGITPLKAMAESLVPRGAQVLLVHVVRTERELVGAAHFRAMASRHPRFMYAPFVTRPSDEWTGYTGRPTPAWIDAHAGAAGIARADVYLCGPDAMMAALTAGLRALGLNEARCFREDFGCASPVAGETPDEVVPHRVALEGTAPVVWQGEPTLLHCLEEAGAPELRDCGAGHCGSCAVRLVSGTVGEIRPAQWPLRPGEVLACCVRPTSDVQLGRVGAPVGRA
ncbi:MAG: 2Fe-2S iron-sulfur cluster-binding protein [Gemmatimonadaceae bacterium]|jgi:hypothetical protein|nr:2Fe-2S iron-sulfur cluster-binding protein [Gemmatimonadaceae bacterium]